MLRAQQSPRCYAGQVKDATMLVRYEVLSTIRVSSGRAMSFFRTPHLSIAEGENVESFELWSDINLKIATTLRT